MHHRFLLPALLLVAVARPDPLPSQSLPKLAPGTRVRITTSDRQHRVTTGVVVAVTNDTMTVRRDDNTPAQFAAPAVGLLETSLGTRTHAGQGALIGAAGGAVLGALLGLAFASGSNDIFGDSTLDRGSWAAYGALTGAIGGAGIGALAGALKRTERWEPVPLLASPRVVAFVGRSGVGLAIRF